LKGSEVQGLGFRVQGSGAQGARGKTQGLGLKGQGFRVQRFSPTAGLESGQFDRKSNSGLTEFLKKRISNIEL